MAKFYARVVVISLSIVMTVITSIVYISPSFYQYDDRSTLDLDEYSTGVNKNTQPDTRTYIKRHPLYTLATDDNQTNQIFSWIETKTAKDICSTVDYNHIDLPHMSVIICFHGKENIANLLHTIHSVTQRTPPELLEEVILIDDASSNADFAQVLEFYTSAMFDDKVRILRNPQRLGLIRSRLKGIQAAIGDVVVSMDSHVEVQPGWAEPLLHEISKNPKTLAASYIDWMERIGDRWQYRHGGTLWKTYFDWTFIFGWQAMSEAEIRARKNLIEPINAPVIIGTIFAIRRDYFFQVGAFDDQMELWGGENLDLPIRVWLCGGRVINVPCSRIGHMETNGNRDYRRNPEWEAHKFINYRRFAEVWAGEFKKYFYMYTPETNMVSAGDVSKRMKLHDVCLRDFSWYLENIFPELGMPDRDGLAWGELKNDGSGQCFDTRNSLFPGQAPCNQGGNKQAIYWSKDLHLRFPIHMVNLRDQSSPGSPMIGLYMDEYISRYKTHSGSKYIHIENGPIVELNSNLCLDASIADVLKFATCDAKSTFQKWNFQHYTQAYDELLHKNSTETVIKEASNIYFRYIRTHRGVAVTIRTPS